MAQKREEEEEEEEEEDQDDQEDEIFYGYGFFYVRLFCPGSTLFPVMRPRSSSLRQ